MSFPKLILIGSIAVFSLIGIAGLSKKFSEPKKPISTGQQTLAQKKEMPLVKQAVQSMASIKKSPSLAVKPNKASTQTATSIKEDKPTTQLLSLQPTGEKAKDSFIDIDRIHQLYTTGPSKLPIVETVSYSSKVSWLKGRPAWVADYASYYGTSRHFIARSLNGKADYLTQKITAGSRFNVFKKDKKIDFHLLIDISRCKMAFYYYDHDTNERVLLKTYSVGLGRIDSQKSSGSLTPVGNYVLGSKVAIYKPGTTGYFQDKKVEMVHVFGTRWIPFEQRIDNAVVATKGYGIQGAPWIEDKKTGKFIENKECIGKYDSDGCVRLVSADIEELFSIVITKPTYVHVVKDFHDAKLPGVEVATPTR